MPLFSSDPVTLYIPEAPVDDALAFAAQTLGVEHAGSGTEVPETRWRLMPIAGKTWADVAGPSDLVLLRDDP